MTHATAPSPRAKVVVIDDEQSIRYSFETFLEDEGYNVACAADLEIGRQLIEKFLPDIIFSDIILGSDNGLMVLEAAKQLDLQAPVIMITGQPSVDNASEALRLGAYDYLVKPITKDSLLRVCRTALNTKRLEEQKERILAEKDRLRQHLQAIFANVDDPIVSVDTAKRVIACNDAAHRILKCGGCAQERGETCSKKNHFPTCAGKSFQEIDSPFLQACQESIEKVLAYNESIKHERKSFIDAKGRPCLISINCSPLKGADNELLGAALVVKDLTRISYLESQLKETTEFRKIIGNSYKMLKVYELIRALADTDATVLITGDSGTGKSLVARQIHELSERAANKMVTVRCSALVEQLLESELFGHVKGAFTGAIKNKVGRFEMCDKGSIFLDEIGEVSPAVQLKLLGVIQDREFERVGDSQSISVDTRIIAATNKNLKAEVAKGNFREDLYYRLNVVEIKMPSLNERHGDVPLLVEHFMWKFRKVYKKQIERISEEVMAMFQTYPWPGNVRELEHAIEHAFVLCKENTIDVRHIPPTIPCMCANVAEGNREVLSEDEEREELVFALLRTDWNKAKAARLLGISRPTLYRKLEKFKMDQE
jgi:two-component system, NtrC family, response regulator HydG